MKTNGTIKGIKLSLNLNIGEVSFKEEYNRKQNEDVKRNFKHNVAKDIKLSLDTEIEEITIEELDKVVKEIKQEVVKNIKETAKPVDSDVMASFCESVLRRERKITSHAEYKRLLIVYFNYSEDQLDNLQHSPEALLRRECKKYLVKRIENL